MNFYNQHVTSIPNNVVDLSIEYCTMNKIMIPSCCTRLVFCNNMTDLPELPSGLINLDCSDNLLSVLPSLPENLQYLNCKGNRLSRIPKLPSSMLKLVTDDIDVEINYKLISWRNGTLENIIRSKKLQQYNDRRNGIGLESVTTIPTKEEWDDIHARFDYRINGEKYLYYSSLM